MAIYITHKEQNFAVGDNVRIHQKIKEQTSKGERSRIQFFEGLVIATRGEAENKSFTVRRIAVGGIGVERIFPLDSPLIEKVDIIAKGSARRAKLYYLRDKTQKEVADVTKRYSRLKSAQAASLKKSKTRIKPKTAPKKVVAKAVKKTAKAPASAKATQKKASPKKS
jgi:large subunit ribosomal protein L19